MAQPQISDIQALHDDALVSINQAATMLGVTGNTIRRRIFLTKEIQATFVGKRPFLTGKELKRQLSTQRPRSFKDQFEVLLNRIEQLESRIQVLEIK